MLGSSEFKKRGSLKISLILPFVTLIALLTGTLALLWYWTGSKTVSTLSQQLMSEMAQRISQTIERHMYSSQVMLDVAFPVGLPMAEDISPELESLRQRLWVAASLSDQGSGYVHFGNPGGQGIGILVKDNGTGELRLKTRAEDHRDYYRLSRIDAKAEHFRTEDGLFDPRTRPWYQQAAEQQGEIWTPIYIDFNAADLVMTRARAVMTANGQLGGVVATDVFLRGLQQFVEQLPLPVGSQAFILETDGNVVAGSALGKLITGKNGDSQRVHAGSSENALLRAIGARLDTMLDSTTHIGISTVNAADNGAAVEIAYRRVRDGAGLDWLAVVAVPHEDMLAGIRGHVVLVFALGMLALGLALALGLRIFGGVAHDMSILTRAVREVGSGQIDAPIELRRTDEIGELAYNFGRMRHSLFTDALTNCFNRSALQHVMATLSKPGPDGELPPPFALLFIDLNRFKPLNDRWGHDNGDLALHEVAQRIRAQLRTTDFLARLGGDEFVAILQGIEHESSVMPLVTLLKEQISQPLRSLQDIPADEEITVGAAIGFALYPRDSEDPAQLLKLADQAMYANKENSRER